MSLWVKICANTSLQDAQLAADFGADAVGFVFAASRRRVTVEQVADIVPHLPHRLEKIGVFVDVSMDEIAATVEATGLTGVQLHFDTPPSLPLKLRERFGPGLRIVRTMHFVSGELAQSLSALELDSNIDAILIDSKTATHVGGTGQVYDWASAANAVFDKAKARKSIAAGGLTPENVAEAIRVLKPWGVDVASGVETAPGRKDTAKLRAFIQNARAASVPPGGQNSRP
jgi:phosphoribosylanthranilate isomerase